LLYGYGRFLGADKRGFNAGTLTLIAR